MISNISLTENSSGVNTFSFKEGQRKIHKINNNMDKHRFFKKIALLCCAIMISSLGLRGQTQFDVGGISYEITSPNTVKVIESSIGYTGDVVIPDTVQYSSTQYAVTGIAEEAFASSSGLTSVDVPATVTNIEQWAFANSPDLAEINVSPTNSNYSSINGVLFSKLQDVLLAFPAGSIMTNYVIPNTVETIGNGAFASCGLLLSIDIPLTVSLIDSFAFSDCYLLTTVSLPDSLPLSIKDYAFANCMGLTSISLPDTSPTTIGNYAFYDCENLASLIIPKSVLSIGDFAFLGCISISDFTVDANNPNYTSSGGVLLNKSKDTLIMYPPAKNATSYQLIDTVEVIVDYAFAYCDNLKQFGWRSGSKLKTIGANAFTYCQNITTIQLPNVLTTIGEQAFAYCDSLPVITIPASVTSIGDNAFENCSQLAAITIEPTNNHYASSDGVLLNKNADTLMLYPMGKLNTGYTIPSSVTTIRGYAFNRCTFLDTIDIPSSVNKIEDLSFVDVSLSNIYMRAINPPLTEPYAFVALLNTFSLHLPCGSVINYQNNANISNMANSYFEDIVPLISLQSSDVLKGTATTTLLNTCQNTEAEITAVANQGYEFLQWNDTNTNNPRSIFVTQDTSFTASFIALYNVLVTANNPMMGSVSGNGTYRENTIVELKATPYPTYRFVGWSDGITDSVRTINLTKDTSFTAIFVAGYSITVLPNDITLGSVTGSGDYVQGTITSISAVAFQNCRFVRWSDGNTQNPRSITVTQDSTFTAIFVSRYQITVSANDLAWGSVFGTGIFDYDSTATIIARANTGYRFLYWSDGNIDTLRTITVTRDSLFTAIFIPYYSITVTTNNALWGNVTGGGDYEQNSTAVIEAFPSGNNRFLRWNDNNTQNPRNVTVTQDSSFTAIFTGRYTVTITANNPIMGSVSGSGMYDLDSMAILTATPYQGYRFVRWSDGDIQNPRQHLVQADTAIEAVFVAGYLVFTQANNVAWGSVTGGGDFISNTSTTLTAIPNQNCRFVQWNDGNTQNPRTITVTQDSLMTAIFACSRQITVQSSNTMMGDVMGGGTYDHDSIVVLTATPQPGYRFLRWNDNNTDNPRTITVSADGIFTAFFVRIHFISLTSNNPSMGSLEGEGFYDLDSIAVLTAKPNTNCVFLRWDDGNTQNPRTITVTQDSAFSALFSGTFHVSLFSDDLTMGDVIGENDYPSDSTVTITAVAEQGYIFVQWNDGNTDNPRFITVTQDTSFTAFFEYNSFHLSVLANDPTMGSVTGGGDYRKYSSVIIDAVPNPGYHFVQWNDRNTDNPRAVTVSTDTVFTAEFAKGTAIEQLQMTDYKLRIYPNPTTGQFTIQSEDLEIENVEIFDIVGRMQTMENRIENNEIVIDISHLSAGTYFIKIKTEQKVIIKKVIKQ